jgi:hypothetical protein
VFEPNGKAMAGRPAWLAKEKHTGGNRDQSINPETWQTG